MVAAINVSISIKIGAILYYRTYFYNCFAELTSKFYADSYKWPNASQND